MRNHKLHSSIVLLILIAVPIMPSSSLTTMSKIHPVLSAPAVSDVHEDGTVDVTVKVESVAEDVTIDANDHSKKKQLTSGVYDLRLFRDSQLVGTSARREAIERYIADAPAAVEKDRIAYEKDPKNSLLNTNEDKLWRTANAIIPETTASAAPAPGVCTPDKDSATKATCVFRNIKLPRDGRDKVDFSAYAFNVDRVKSETARMTYSIAKPSTTVGNTYLLTIGVNETESPNYKPLRYAANDAKVTQEVLGDRLEAKAKAEGSKLIRVSLVSTTTLDGKREVTATKSMIKATFLRMAGIGQEELARLKDKEKDDVAAALEALKKIADIPPVQPEDTLIITFSGHGYTDRNGIFYMLPYDVGATTTALTTEVLKKLISSDELSLWMSDITAREMIMIIDACHSSSAVQGPDFKPGPMGSRGLGQLAYDKDMKILSATQSDNVALETECLKQGLLTYALIQDGIVKQMAVTPKDKTLKAEEWLSFAEKRVPELYTENRAGQCRVTPGQKGSGEVDEAGVKTAATLQQPTLFNFKRRKLDSGLATLP